MTLEQLESTLDLHVPRWRTHSVIEALVARTITVRMPFQPELLRGGNTLSGPSLMALADRAAYMLSLVHGGGDPMMATANLDIHFLARAPAGDAVATATLLRAGRRLIVTRVEIHAGVLFVAHATVTYAVYNPYT